MLVDDVGERWVIVHSEKGERVRRYKVAGGWLYQVETEIYYTEGIMLSGWTPPVFVPDGSIPNAIDSLRDRMRE